MVLLCWGSKKVPVSSGSWRMGERDGQSPPVGVGLPLFLPLNWKFFFLSNELLIHPNEIQPVLLTTPTLIYTLRSSYYFASWNKLYWWRYGLKSLSSTNNHLTAGTCHFYKSRRNFIATSHCMIGQKGSPLMPLITRRSVPLVPLITRRSIPLACLITRRSVPHTRHTLFKDSAVCSSSSLRVVDSSRRKHVLY